MTETTDNEPSTSPAEPTGVTGEYTPPPPMSLKDAVVMAMSIMGQALPGATVIVMASRPSGEHYIVWKNAQNPADCVGLSAMGQHMIVTKCLEGLVSPPPAPPLTENP